MRALAVGGGHAAETFTQVSVLAEKFTRHSRAERLQELTDGGMFLGPIERVHAQQLFHLRV